MSKSQAHAKWDGTIKAGKGTMTPAHGPDVPFSFSTRFEGVAGSNPEEMIGAALSGCFSMALSLGLEQAGMTPLSIQTNADVYLDKVGAGFEIRRIDLSTDAKVSGGDDAKFQAVAEETKRQCPVSKVLKGAEITLRASVTR